MRTKDRDAAHLRNGQNLSCIVFLLKTVLFDTRHLNEYIAVSIVGPEAVEIVCMVWMFTSAAVFTAHVTLALYSCLCIQISSLALSLGYLLLSSSQFVLSLPFASHSGVQSIVQSAKPWQWYCDFQQPRIFCRGWLAVLGIRRAVLVTIEVCSFLYL